MVSILYGKQIVGLAESSLYNRTQIFLAVCRERISGAVKYNIAVSGHGRGQAVTNAVDNKVLFYRGELSLTESTAVKSREKGLFLRTLWKLIKMRSNPFKAPLINFLCESFQNLLCCSL